MAGRKLVKLDDFGADWSIILHASGISEVYWTVIMYYDSPAPEKQTSGGIRGT